jgi:hypothetical protein
VPIVIVPLREADDVFAAAVYVSVPFPLPLVGDIVSHALSLVAVQAQVAPVNVMLPVPPPAAIEIAAGEIV